MPRTGGVYSPPAGTKGVSNTTIQSVPYNAFVDDLTDDANAARPVTAGGTGATTASGARTALGLAIGTNVQAYDALLQSIAGLTTSANQMIYLTGTDTAAVATITAYGRSLIDDADAATARTTLGLGTAAIRNTGTSGFTIPFLDGTNTWSSIQTISNGSGGSGDVWGGRLLYLSNFAPGIFLNDQSTSTQNSLITVDSSIFRIYGTPNTDGTSLTSRFSINLTSGDTTVGGSLTVSTSGSFGTTLSVTGASTLTGRVNFGERIVSTGTDAIIGTTDAGQILLRPNGGSGNFTTGQVTITPSAMSVGVLNVTNTLTLTNALTVANGGTGATTASGARTNLGLGGLAVMNLSDLYYTGSSSSNTTFPVSSYLFAQSDDPLNNDSRTLRLTSGNARFNTASGTALTGTWRARGTEDQSGSRATLFQRTA